MHRVLSTSYVICLNLLTYLAIRGWQWSLNYSRHWTLGEAREAVVVGIDIIYWYHNNLIMNSSLVFVKSTYFCYVDNEERESMNNLTFTHDNIKMVSHRISLGQ